MDAGIVVWAHLWNGGVSPELASEIKRVLLSSPPSDPKQRAELVAAYLWATDKNVPRLFLFIRVFFLILYFCSTQRSDPRTRLTLAG